MKKDRGRGNVPGSTTTPKYGAVDVQETIEGVNLLDEGDSGDEEELIVDGAQVVDDGDSDSLLEENSPDVRTQRRGLASARIVHECSRLSHRL